MDIDLPSVIVKQRIAHQLNILDVRQKIEKRIARRRNQKFIARIAKRSKDVGIRFACAGGEENIFDRDFVFAFSVVTSNRPASGFQPPRIGFVGERGRVCSTRSGLRNYRIRNRIPWDSKTVRSSNGFPAVRCAARALLNWFGAKFQLVRFANMN